MAEKLNHENRDGIESWIEVCELGGYEVAHATASVDGVGNLDSAFVVDSIAVHCTKGMDPRAHAINLVRLAVYRKVEAFAEGEEHY